MKKLLTILLILGLVSCNTHRPNVPYKSPNRRYLGNITLVILDNPQVGIQNNKNVYTYKAVRLTDKHHDTVTLHVLHQYKIGDKLFIPISNEN